MGLNEQHATFARDPDGDWEMPLRLVRGAEAVRIRLEDRLSNMKGGWFLDQSYGVPYLEQIFVKSPDISLVIAVFSRVILSTPGVSHIRQFRPVYDPAARSFVLDNLNIKLDDGTPVRVQDGSLVIPSPVFIPE